MVKSLILSALLSFGTASYEFDCSNLLLFRDVDSQTYNFSIDFVPNGHLIIDDLTDVMFLNLSFISDESSLYDVEDDFDWNNEDFIFSLYDPNEGDYYDITSIGYVWDEVDPSIWINSDDYQIIIYNTEIDYRYNGLDYSYSLSVFITEDVNLTLNYNEYLMFSMIFSDYISSDSSILSEIGNVLMWVPAQFVTLFSTLTGVFYSEGALTLPGLFLVIGLGVFICALILDFILKFRKI